MGRNDFIEAEREKIIYFGLTFKQKTLIITAPKDNSEQEKFLGYGWSNAKGREGIVHKKRGGMLFDNENHAADDKISTLIRAACIGEEIHIPALEKYYRYSILADMIDFDADNFTKKINLGSSDYKMIEYSGEFPIKKLGEVAPFVTERITIDKIAISDFITTDNMLKDKKGVKIYDGVPQISGLVKFLAGDVLISNIRPHLKKIWLADRAGGCSPDVLVFRSFDEKILSSEYLFEVLRQDDFFAFANANSNGMKMPRGDKDKIKSYKIPLPPLDVQKKIISEFQSIDSQINSAEETIKSLDAYIKAKFAALFGGISRAYKYPLDSFEKFVYVRSGDTFKEKYQGGKNPDDIPFYKVSDMNSKGNEKIMDKANNYVSETTLTEEIRANIFDEGTIIFPKVGMAIGTNKKRILGRRAAVDNNTMAIWLKNDSLNNEYLFSFLKFCFNLSSVANNSNPPSISAQNFNRAKIMVPPLEMQKEFSSYVENCETMKESARQKLLELKTEREELVNKYFR